MSVGVVVYAFGSPVAPQDRDHSAERTAKSPRQQSGTRPRRTTWWRLGVTRVRGSDRPSVEAPMVNPIPAYISPERLERLKELADASRLRAVLFASTQMPPVQRR